MTPDLTPHLPVACGRADTEIMRVGQLALLFTRCSTRKTRPCSSPWQHSRANLESVKAGELDLSLAQGELVRLGLERCPL